MEITLLNLTEIRAIIADMRVEAVAYREFAAATPTLAYRVTCIAEATVLEHWALRLECALIPSVNG